MLQQNLFTVQIKTCVQFYSQASFVLQTGPTKCSLTLRNMMEETDNDSKFECTFTIEFSYKVADNASFHMYDMLGRKVKTISLTGKGKAVTISEENLYNGLYIYELRIDGEIKVSDKVIVHR